MPFQLAPLQTFTWNKPDFRFLDIYREHLHEAIGCSDPEKFHQFVPAERMPKDTVEGTAHTYGHDILYAIDPSFRQANYVRAKDRGFIALYRQFIWFIQEEIFNIPLVFQRLPSLRIHYPGYTSYGVMHTDQQYNHPPDEINIWVPITRAIGTATMIIESEVGKGDYSPVEMDYGNLLIFDSALTHGNRVNEEGYTRMSFDMRVIPQKKYHDPAGTYSTTAHKEFRIGDYYDVFSL
ncbi:MAG: hypothetical protein CFH10_00346 [Alphaproteobacteria bacterium MarineAlpha4_Bin2]|nr:MAG: hypothetical protein CFH10_00346 [Alphaproteobacteria bacterium MarineAlpha4_Bin2]